MKRIVIVEDHAVLVSIYRNKFASEGFKVETASDGESGLELINRIKPDLVVLDLAMPKVNGIEVLKILRANPLFQTLPVIIFSDSAWKQQAWKEGATVVLSKSNHTPSQVVESARNLLLRPRTERQVLLVEDQYDIRTTISSALNQSGFRVKGVDCHGAALQEVETRDFDAYLLNRECPDGMGLSLCHQLRKLYPQKPIVIYSNGAFPITPEQRLEAGASAYLTEAGDIMNPGRVLLKLMDEAKTTSVYVEGKVALDLSVLTR